MRLPDPCDGPATTGGFGIGDVGPDVDVDHDERLLELYRFTVSTPMVTRAQLIDAGLSSDTLDADLTELRARGLIKPGEIEGSWDAVPPDVVLTAAAGRLEHRASDTRALAFELSLAYQHVRAPHGIDRHGIRRLSSLQELDAAMEDVVTQAERELRCLRTPSPHTALAFGGGLEHHQRRLVSADGHPLRRRCVYDARTLSLPTAQDVLAARSQAGEETRFLTPLPLSLTVADDEIAVLDLTSYDSSGTGSMVVTDPSLVSALAQVVETCWQLATPMSGPTIDDLDQRTTDILQLLAAGISDAAIAEQVGVSQRTVERRVRSLMDQLGVTTRFQAGVQAVHRGWL